jgi:hypothetical protein
LLEHQRLPPRLGTCVHLWGKCGKTIASQRVGVAREAREHARDCFSTVQMGNDKRALERQQATCCGSRVPAAVNATCGSRQLAASREFVHASMMSAACILQSRRLHLVAQIRACYRTCAFFAPELGRWGMRLTAPFRLQQTKVASDLPCNSRDAGQLRKC